MAHNGDYIGFLSPKYLIDSVISQAHTNDLPPERLPHRGFVLMGVEGEDTITELKKKYGTNDLKKIEEKLLEEIKQGEARIRNSEKQYDSILMGEGGEDKITELKKKYGTDDLKKIEEKLLKEIRQKKMHLHNSKPSWYTCNICDSDSECEEPVMEEVD